jgi:hypothetical protein
MTATFASELRVAQLSAEPGAWRLWRIDEPLVYDVAPEVNAERRRARAELEASGFGQFPSLPERLVVVPAEFVTDGPSVPRFLWAVLPVWGSWSRAGVVHDYLCCLVAMGRPHDEAPTRTDADRVFREAMFASGVGWLARTALYAGVRIGTICGVETTMVTYNEKLRAALGARRTKMINSVQGIGMTERTAYAVLVPLVTTVGAKTGWYDAEMAAYLTGGIILLVGNARAWWTNRPQNLLNDAAGQLPGNTKLVMQTPPQASASDKQEVRKLEEATVAKVEAKIAA